MNVDVEQTVAALEAIANGVVLVLLRHCRFVARRDGVPV
jgi:hypothetical protein